MTCSSCVDLIESTLLRETGVKTASVALATQRGKFTFDPQEIGDKEEDKGFGFSYCSSSL